VLVHESNLAGKETRKKGKYSDQASKAYLAEIRHEYDAWHQANVALVGPTATPTEGDKALVAQRVESLSKYKDFIDAQKYAEHFHSKSNLHSSVLEQFVYYLFRDLAASFGPQALIGKSHAFKDIFFQPASFTAMLNAPHARIERKDHDFVIGVSVDTKLETVQPQPRPYEDVEPPQTVREARGDYGAAVDGVVEQHSFDLPAVAIECKTYLDKSMLEGCSRAAEELKARCPNARYFVIMEWLKLSDDVNLMKYQVDQIYVFRRQKNTDQEFRFLPGYEKMPLDPDVVWHLFKSVRTHLTTDWEGGVGARLERGWLL
jgi:Bpu10I-like restriction endonuclease